MGGWVGGWVGGFVTKHQEPCAELGAHQEQHASRKLQEYRSAQKVDVELLDGQQSTCHTFQSLDSSTKIRACTRMLETKWMRLEVGN